MYLNITFRIMINTEMAAMLDELLHNFNVEVNKIVDFYIEHDSIVDVRFNQIENNIPWDSKIEIIKQARNDFLRIKKEKMKRENVNHKYCCWTPRNFRFLNKNKLLMIQTKHQSSQIVDVSHNELLFNIIENNRLIRLRIIKRKNKWLGLLTYLYEPKTNTFINQMSIDLGIKVPAVAITNTGKIRFFGSGRQQKYIHRQARKKLKKMIHNPKDRRDYSWSNKLKYLDHKISKEIIDFAMLEKVGVIKLENLFRLQKRNSKIKGVNTWSYARLYRFIKYKAEKSGIEVVLVDERFTSKRCPDCRSINNTTDRKYHCHQCGYKNHRDIVGAINILNSNLGQKTSL